MKIYISGAISGERDGNKRAFSDAQRRLERNGFEVINPHEICSHLPDGSKWEEYMKVCKAELMKCEALVYLPGWENSRGVLTEMRDAMDVKIPIQSLNYFLETHLEQRR